MKKIFWGIAIVVGLCIVRLLGKNQEKPFSDDYPYVVKNAADAERYDRWLVNLTEIMKMPREEAEGYLATNFQTLGEPPTEPPPAVAVK